ncbi:MAG: hypothetical protein OEL51_01295 [Nitrosopumilus sp.]|nr:hypothetical protein [Nitrosopumilus sp.]
MILKKIKNAATVLSIYHIDFSNGIDVCMLKSKTSFGVYDNISKTRLEKFFIHDGEEEEEERGGGVYVISL